MKPRQTASNLQVFFAFLAVALPAFGQPDCQRQGDDAPPGLAVSHYVGANKLTFDEIMLGRREPRFAQASQPDAWKPEQSDADRRWNLEGSAPESRRTQEDAVYGLVDSNHFAIALLIGGFGGWILLGILASIFRDGETSIL